MPNFIAMMPYKREENLLLGKYLMMTKYSITKSKNKEVLNIFNADIVLMT